MRSTAGSEKVLSCECPSCGWFHEPTFEQARLNEAVFRAQYQWGISQLTTTEERKKSDELARRIGLLISGENEN